MWWAGYCHADRRVSQTRYRFIYFHVIVMNYNRNNIQLYAPLYTLYIQKVTIRPGKLTREQILCGSWQFFCPLFEPNLVSRKYRIAVSSKSGDSISWAISGTDSSILANHLVFSLGKVSGMRTRALALDLVTIDHFLQESVWLGLVWVGLSCILKIPVVMRLWAYIEERTGYYLGRTSRLQGRAPAW